MKHIALPTLAVLVAGAATFAAQAAVSADEAKALGTTLTAIGAEIVDRAHWLPSSVQYPYAAVRSLVTYTPGRYLVAVDGVEREYSAATVVVANSAYYGKGMKIAPAASVTTKGTGVAVPAKAGSGVKSTVPAVRSSS